MLTVTSRPFGRKRERLLIARDITESHKLDRVHRDLVANLSHELRTPITVLTGYLEDLAFDSNVTEEFARPVEHMREQAGRMSDLIDDLLTMSRYELEEPDEGMVEIDMTGLINEVVVEAEVLGDRHQFHLQVDEGVAITANPVELRSVVTNLVVNAVRHTPPLTEVLISWQRESSGARFTVTDNGPGIPARHIPRLTEQFYRVEQGFSNRRKGTGLGLTIVKRVLDKMGAKLAITNVADGGCTFVCHFPASVIIGSPVDSSSSEVS